MTTSMTSSPANPTADAKIMLGKVQLKREKLMEATEVELGSAMAQNSLVPVKSSRSDRPDLGCQWRGAIEVVVWAIPGTRSNSFSAVWR